MEVHSNDLHNVPGHGWKHYFFEFFMLFLAVTAGFFVENQRDHFVEHQKETQFMYSLVDDINSDIYQLDSIINTRKLMNSLMDSLIYILNYTNLRQHGNELYYFTRWIPRTYRFYANDRTILQLKNAGNLAAYPQPESF